MVEAEPNVTTPNGNGTNGNGVYDSPRDRFASSTSNSIRRASYAVQTGDQRSPRRQMTSTQLLQLAQDRRNSVSTLNIEVEDENNEIDYRDNFQIIIGQCLADTADMVDSNLCVMKERLLSVIPPERIAKHSVLRINHLRPLPPRIGGGDSQPKLRCTTKIPTTWYTGHPIKPAPVVELYDATTGLPIPGWSAALSVRVSVINGCEDLVHERYDGRSVCVGNKAWLDGSEASFPELRILGESSRHKRGVFYLVFHMPEYSVEPWKSPPINITDVRSHQLKPQDIGEYMYEEETEEVVEFSIPAHHNVEEDTDEMWEARKGQISPLLVACGRGQVQLVQLLLEKGDDVNYAEAHGLTALHFACFVGYRELVETLVKNGASVTQQSNCGFSALQYAVLSCRIDVNSRLEVLRYLLTCEGVDVNLKSYEGWTALHIAAHCGKSEVISLLTSRGAEVDAVSNDGQTALHLAAFLGHTKCVQTLVDAGAKVDALAENGWGLTMQAVLGGSEDTLKALLNTHKCPSDTAGVSGHTPLSAASLTAKIQAIDMLLENGAKGGFLAGNGWSPVMCAAASGDLNSVKKTVGAKIPVIGGNGDSALGVASAFGYKDICDYLKEYVPRDHPDQAAAKKGPSTDLSPGPGGTALLDKKNKKAISWKRGDVASFETLVRILKEGDQKTQMDALSTIVDDMKLSDGDCRKLMDQGVMQCLLNYIRQEEVNNQILSQALKLLKRLASSDATRTDVHLTAVIRDLVGVLNNAATAADVITILESNHNLKTALDSIADGGKTHSQLASHFGQGSGVASGAAAADVRTPQKPSGPPPSRTRPASKPGTPSVAPPSAPPPALPGKAPPQQPDSGRANISKSEATWAELISERLGATDRPAVFVTGRTGSGRSTLITEAVGQKAPPSKVIVTEEGEILSQSITIGERSMVLYDHKGLDPGIDSHVDAWYCITQFILNSLAQPDSSSESTAPPRVSTVWYCIDPANKKLEKPEQEWITALAEFVPVVLVITKTTTDPRATHECQQFLERISPPLPFFEPIVCVHAKASGASEQVTGFNDLATVTAKAYDDARRMATENQKAASTVLSERLVGSVARRCSNFIAPVLQAVKLLAVVGIPLNHASTTLEPVGIPMVKGISHVFGLLWSDQTVSTVWGGVFHRAEFLKSLVRSAPGGANASNLDVDRASLILLAMATGLTHILAEHAIGGTLLSTEMNALMSAVIELMEQSVERGLDALLAEYNSMRAGKLEPRGTDDVDVM